MQNRFWDTSVSRAKKKSIRKLRTRLCNSHCTTRIQREDCRRFLREPGCLYAEHIQLATFAYGLINEGSLRQGYCLITGPQSSQDPQPSHRVPPYSIPQQSTRDVRYRVVHTHWVQHMSMPSGKGMLRVCFEPYTRSTESSRSSIMKLDLAFGTLLPTMNSLSVTLLRRVALSHIYALVVTGTQHGAE